MASLLPYDMFDLEKSADEARRFSKLSNIYHKGQSLAWDGNAVLDELWDRHGGSGLEPRQLIAAQRVLGSIMWGELAAWKIAAQLADELQPLEARMAATSQAHDEARHFYVMHDFLLRATGDFPRGTNRASEKLMAAALTADTIPKKLLGMQLQLEAMALTIFHALRESNCCPVLTELLVYYEKDEARHVGLGMQLLPTLMRKMSPPQVMEFIAFSLKVGAISIWTLKANEADLRTLGIDPRRVAVLGKSKQMLVFGELFRIVPEARVKLPVGNVLDAVAEALWPSPGAAVSLGGRAKRVLQTLKTGYEKVDTSLEPEEPPHRSPSAAAE